MKNLHYIKQQLFTYFGKESIVTIDDFRIYFRERQPNMKDTAIRGRIHDLKQSGFIQSAGRGKYALQNKAIFQPLISQKLKKISKLISQNFEIDYCISSTQWLGEFSLHQAFQQLFILEAKKDFLLSIFDIIRDNGRREVYLNPNKNTFYLYAASAQSPIILKSLPSRAPIQQVSNIWVPTLEKMLVDLFVDEQTFYAYQGQEMIHIFEKAIQLYQLDYSRMFSYAERRKKKVAIQQFLKEKISNFPKLILND